MKTKFLLFILLITFSTSILYAQIQNEKGKIVYKSGAIVNCQISYFFDQPSKIFIIDSSSNKSIIDPIQIKEMVLENGEKYVLKMYKNKLDSLSLIFQTLIESPKISLYMRDERDKNQLYVSKDNIFYKLENNEKIITNKEGTFRGYDYLYIGILKALMSDNHDIIEKLDNVKLTVKDIVEITTQYNNGDITYFWSTDTKIKKSPDWVLFGQYSNYHSYYTEQTTGFSFGVVTGFQYYFSSHSRHSFKFAIDYSNYKFEYDTLVSVIWSGTGFKYLWNTCKYNPKTYSLSCRYEYDFIKKNKYDFYLIFHFVDISYFSNLDKHFGPKKNFGIYPRLNPGFGLEIKPLNRFAIYAEINHLGKIRNILFNYSIGLKYNLSKNSW